MDSIMWDRNYITICFFIFFVNVSKAQVPYKNFSNADGLAQTTNYFLLKDSKGYLWISTNDGLCRFDGRNFQSFSYSPMDSLSLHGGNVNNFIEVENSNLFVGTNRGLNYYNSISKTFKRVYFIEDKSREVDVYVLSIVKDTLLVFDDVLGLTKINTKNFKIISTDATFKVPSQFDGVYLLSYFEAVQKLFLVGKAGLLYYDLNNKKKKEYAFTDSIFATHTIKALNCIKSLTVSTLGLGFNGGFAIFDISLGEIVFIYKKNNFDVTSIKLENENELWIGTSRQGIFKYNNKELKQVAINSKSVKDVTSFYFTDRNVFFNEDRKGLSRISKSQAYLNSYTIKEVPFKIKNDLATYCFAEDNRGNIWLGTRNNGVIVYNKKNKRFNTSKHDFNFELKNLSIKSLLYANSKMYVGTDMGLYMYTFDNKKLVAIKLPEGKSNNLSRWCNHLMKATNNEIYLGTKDGIYKVDTTKNLLFDLTGNSLFSYYLFENAKGDLLTTSQTSNLAVYASKHNKFYLQAEYLKHFNIMSIWEDVNKKEYWFACREGILNTDVNFKILNYFNTQNGLKSNCHYGIISDDYNCIWVTSNNNIVHINLNTKALSYFFSDNELSGVEFTGKGFFKSVEKKIYFGSEQGFDEFDSKMATNLINKSYTLQLEQIKINGKSANENQLMNIDNCTLQLLYDENNIDLLLNVVNCDLGTAENILYKLEGLNDYWQEVTPNTWIQFHKLLPKAYKLKYKVKGDVDTKINELIIIIKPAWYQTWLFKIIILLLVAALLYTIYAFRIRQLKKIITVRKKISSDLHDDLGSTLSTISMYSQVAQLQHKASPHIHLIQENTKEALDKLDDIVWATNPKNDKLENLIERIQNYAKPLLNAKDIQFVFKYDATLKTIKINEAVRQSLFLIVKEAINNLLKYADAKECTLLLQYKGKAIHCTIADDGRGFNTSILTERNGLLNMQQRVLQLNGLIDIKSEIGVGSIITFQLPL